MLAARWEAPYLNRNIGREGARDKKQTSEPWFELTRFEPKAKKTKTEYTERPFKERRTKVPLQTDCKVPNTRNTT